MVWDGMLPGEQEKTKTIIRGEKDWIIWRTKPEKGEQGDHPGGSGNSVASVLCVVSMVCVSLLEKKLFSMFLMCQIETRCVYSVTDSDSVGSHQDWGG